MLSVEVTFFTRSFKHKINSSCSKPWFVNSDQKPKPQISAAAHTDFRKTLGQTQVYSSQLTKRS